MSRHIHYRPSDFIDEARREGAVIKLGDADFILTLIGRMENDKKHLAHAIYDDWFWSDDMDAEELLSDARKRVETEVRKAKELGRPLNNIDILNATAACYVAWCLIDTQRNARLAEEAAEENIAAARGALRAWRAA